MRISYSLWHGHWGNLDPVWGQKMFFCLILREFSGFFWDPGLTLFDISKDVDFAKI